MKSFLFSLILAGVVGCSPCHTGHTDVDYVGAHTSMERTYVGNDNYVYYTEYHPARCDTWRRCDLSCDALDKGRTEKHPPHQTLNLYGDRVDPRCNWDGRGVAWPK